LISVQTTSKQAKMTRALPGGSCRQKQKQCTYWWAAWRLGPYRQAVSGQKPRIAKTTQWGNGFMQ